MNTATLVEPGTVKMERLLPGPVERVWAYLTESDKRATWLAAGEFDLRLGGAIRLEFDNSKLPNDPDTPAKYQRCSALHETSSLHGLVPDRHGLGGLGRLGVRNAQPQGRHDRSRGRDPAGPTLPAH